MGLFIVVVLIFRYLLDGLLKQNNDMDSPFAYSLQLWTDYILVGISCVFVTLPLGVPIVTAISFLYTLRWTKMESLFVKNYAVCEKMGQITDLVMEKTGVITENSLRINRVWINKDMTFDLVRTHRIDPAATFPELVWPLLEMSFACNVSQNCSYTDKACVDFIEKCGRSTEEIKRLYGVGI